MAAHRRRRPDRAHGYITISDRAKDVVKSGGEWISTLELEYAILTHPAVREVAVIAAPDERWGERPLACVTLVPGQSVTSEELRAHLADRVVKWWVPEQWVFVDEVPRTTVGKHDKKLLRERNAEGGLRVVTGGDPSAGTGKPNNLESVTCLKSLSPPSAGRRSAAPSRARSSTCGPTTSAPTSSTRCSSRSRSWTGEIDDVICGCGLPGGEQGHNLARIISILAGVDAPGTTVNRYCASSLQAVRMAVARHPGGRGRRRSSPPASSASPARRSACSRTRRKRATRGLRRATGRGYPDIYIAMGVTAENVADE